LRGKVYTEAMKPQRRLKVGDRIPDFWTRDLDGREVDSREFKGYTLLVFLRYAGCPFCNLAVLRLNHEHKLLQKNGCEVIVFIQSSEETIEKYVLSRQDKIPAYSVVADQQQDFYRLFGVRPNASAMMRYTAKNASHWMEAVFEKSFTQQRADGSPMMVPAYFLVDDKGIIQLADYEASLYDDASFTPIYDVLTFGPLS